jgi:cell division septum initiation protein DivIVA
MDVHDRLDQLTATVRSAKTMPMSASCLVNRAEMLDILERLREQLIEQTDVLVAVRAHAATVTTDARAESTRLLADADDYVDRKLAEFEVLLGQLASQVNNGRLRLTSRREADLARFQETVLAESAVVHPAFG